MESASAPWQRQATSARWKAALARAITDGVCVYKISGSGQWVATSGSRAGVAYAVTLTDCECEAATRGGDPVCRHRAALAHRLGYLDLDPESPVPPAALGVPVYQCPTCQDTGSVVKTSPPWSWAKPTGRPARSAARLLTFVPASPRRMEAYMAG